MNMLIAYNRKPGQLVFTKLNASGAGYLGAHVGHMEKRHNLVYNCVERWCKGKPEAALTVLIPEAGDKLRGTICFGISRCHRKDTFSKKEGRRISLGYAEQVRDILLKHPNKSRDKFWYSPTMLWGHAPETQLNAVLYYFKNIRRIVSNQTNKEVERIGRFLDDSRTVAYKKHAKLVLDKIRDFAV